MVKEMLSTDDLSTLFLNNDQFLCFNGSNLRFSFCFLTHYSCFFLYLKNPVSRLNIASLLLVYYSTKYIV